MIVDDHHALAAVLAAEAVPADARLPPVYLDARISTTMHLRLVSALLKPTGGRLTRVIQTAVPDGVARAALIQAIATPRSGVLSVMDDRPFAAAIGALTAEVGVSIAFGSLIAHAQSEAQPIVVDPANQGRWMDAAAARRVEIIVRPAGGL